MPGKEQSRKSIDWDFPLVGVTGILGSGKSTVARMFADLGALVFDADQAAREVSREREVLAEIAARFGPEFLDSSGKLDRVRMAEAVFSCPERLQELNAIIHPRVRRRMWEFIQYHSQNSRVPMVIIDAPLIYETDLYQYLDFIVVVSASEKECLHRVAKRNGWSEKQIRQRMARQIPLSVKEARADFVIANHGDLQSLLGEVKKIYGEIVKRWKGRRKS